MRNILLVLVFLAISLVSSAEHITGGEMYYTVTPSGDGNYRYNGTIKLFKRCRSNRQLNNTAILSVFKTGTNERIDITLNARLPFDRISLTDPNKCITDPPEVCYEVAYYDFDVLLKESPQGYLLSVQVVFRIAGISNFVSNSGNVGATYTAEIPGSGSAKNNSAQFIGNDLVAVCANNSFSYSFAATDADGDQLRYSFCEAYQGGSSTGGNNINPAAPPPYQSVPYGSGFGGSNPLGNRVTIDSKTGLITGVAPGEGVYVVTVCVEEIRNGVVIATQRKDIQIHVASCTIASATLLPEYQLCKDSRELNIANNSTSPLIKTYNWELINDKGENVYASSNQMLNYTFSDTGMYQIKLIINKGMECSDSITSAARVYPGLKTSFNYSGICVKKPTDFISSSTVVYGSINNWSWDFGELTAFDDVSEKPNPSYQYTSAGTKNVQLIINTTKGCNDTLSQSVAILDKPVIQMAFKDSLICANDLVQLKATGRGTFSWTPAVNLTNVTTATPDATPKTTTVYKVSLDDNGCVNTDSVKIRVVDKVTLQAMADTTICANDPIKLRVTSDALSYSWLPAEQIEEAALPNPLVRTEFTTTYTVTGRIGGCTATDQVVVKSVPYPQVDAGTDTVLCYKSSGQLAGTTDGSSMLWTPGTALSQRNILNPIVRPLETTDYVLTVYDTKGCPKPGRDTVTIVVLDPIKPFAGRDTAVLVDQPMQFNATGGESYQWSPALNLSAIDIADPIANYNAPSEGIKYKVKVFNEAGCVDSAYVTIKVFATGPTVFVPTAFTPNSDGRNDQLRPIAVGIKTIESFSIFDRWGQLVFSTTINGKGWDGKVGGRDQHTESFVWIVQAIDYNNKRYLKKGTVTLIK